MKTRSTARIIEWHDDRGFGFLADGRQRTFIHIRDFAARPHRPREGDLVEFINGHDVHRRPCAKQARQLGKPGRITLASLLGLLLLLLLPGLALLILPVDLRWSFGYFISVSIVTYHCYANDKQRARSRRWRISEATLHGLELIGGWPGAFLAQRRLRHKCSKGRYQFTFRLIVIAFQMLSFDYLAQWKLASTTWLLFSGIATKLADSPVFP